VWAFIVIVFDEFPVEWELRVFLVIGSEPTFNLSERCRFADAAEDMLDPFDAQYASNVDSPLRTLQNWLP